LCVPRLIYAEIGGDEVDLGEKLLARLVVVDLIGLGDPPIAVQAIENFQERRDRLDVAVGDRFARKPHRRLKTRQLQLGVLCAFVDDRRRSSACLTIRRMRSGVSRSSRAISSWSQPSRRRAKMRPRRNTRLCAVSRRASAGALSSPCCLA
jgi:hypothetical protein